VSSAVENLLSLPPLTLFHQHSSDAGSTIQSAEDQSVDDKAVLRFKTPNSGLTWATLFARLVGRRFGGDVGSLERWSARYLDHVS
jgi:hypothetical protein